MYYKTLIWFKKTYKLLKKSVSSYNIIVKPINNAHGTSLEICSNEKDNINKVFHEKITNVI